MEDIRKSFSNLKKDFKRRVRGKKRASDKAGADTVGERFSSSASFLRPDSRAAASGHNEEATRISTDVSQARTRDPSPTRADEGLHDDSQRKKADVDKNEVGQRDSRLDPDVEVATGSGPGRGDERAYPPLSISSIQRKQEPNSTWRSILG